MTDPHQPSPTVGMEAESEEFYVASSTVIPAVPATPSANTAENGRTPTLESLQRIPFTFLSDLRGRTPLSIGSLPWFSLAGGSTDLRDSLVSVRSRLERFGRTAVSVVNSAITPGPSIRPSGSAQSVPLAVNPEPGLRIIRELAKITKERDELLLKMSKTKPGPSEPPPSTAGSLEEGNIDGKEKVGSTGMTSVEMVEQAYLLEVSALRQSHLLELEEAELRTQHGVSGHLQEMIKLRQLHAQEMAETELHGQDEGTPSTPLLGLSESLADKLAALEEDAHLAREGRRLKRQALEIEDVKQMTIVDMAAYNTALKAQAAATLLKRVSQRDASEGFPGGLAGDETIPRFKLPPVKPPKPYTYSPSGDTVVFVNSCEERPGVTWTSDIYSGPAEGLRFVEQFWIHGAGNLMLFHTRESQQSTEHLLFETTVRILSDGDQSRSMVTTTEFMMSVALGGVTHFGANPLIVGSARSTPETPTECRSFPLCGTHPYEHQLFLRFHTSDAVCREIRRNEQNDSAVLSYRVTSQVLKVDEIVPKPGNGYNPSCIRCGMHTSSRCEHRFANLTLQGNLSGIPKHALRHGAIALASREWCGDAVVCHICMNFPMRTGAQGLSYQRATVNGNWSWCRDTNDVNECETDDDSLAGSDTGDDPARSVDVSELRPLDIYKMQNDSRKRDAEAVKDVRIVVEKISEYTPVWDDVSGFLGFINSAREVFSRNNPHMIDAWNTGLTTKRVLLLLTELIKADSPARSALDEQRRANGPAFSSFQKWTILLQGCILSKEAVLEHSRKFRLQQQGSRSINEWHQYLINGRKFYNNLADSPRIDRLTILVMFMGSMSKENRLRDKMLQKHKDIHIHSFHNCPPPLARQRLIEMVQLAQELEVRIRTKRNHSSSSTRPSSSPHRFQSTSRLSALQAELAQEESFLLWTSTNPTQSQGRPVSPYRGNSTRGAAPTRTTQQAPIGLTGTDRQAAPGLRPTQAGPPNLTPKACWACGSTEHLKFDCNATPAVVEAFRNARIPLLQANRPRLSLLREDAAREHEAEEAELTFLEGELSMLNSAVGTSGTDDVHQSNLLTDEM